VGQVRQTSAAKEFSFLPGELWRRISDLLTTKEWAAASGTCAAMWQLQPDRISCSVSSSRGTVSALLWLPKHCNDASIITFEVTGNPEVIIAKGDLEMIVGSSQHMERYPVSTEIAVLRISSRTGNTALIHKRCVDWLYCLLARAPRLKALQLGPTKKNWQLPTMTNLKHLVIAIGKRTTIRRGYFEQVGNLQTLHVTSESDIYIDDKAALPHGLQHFCCSSLEEAQNGAGSPRRWDMSCLPQQCVIKVQTNADTFKSEFLHWPDHTLTQVASLALTASGQVYIETKQGVPGVDPLGWSVMPIKKVPGIKSMCITKEPMRILILNLPIAASLSHLSTLHLEADKLIVGLPASTALRRVCLRGFETLILNLEDPWVTATRLQVFELTYMKEELWFGADVLSLQTFVNGLHERGLKLVAKKDPSSGMTCARLSSERADMAGWETLCDCQCCWDCLARAGKILM
jgi:hypothetical protein